MATLMNAIVRGIALLLLIAATGFAIDRWTLQPLRCGHAASLGADALDRDNQSVYQAARQVRADLHDCECVSPPDASIPTTLAAAAEASEDPRTAITEYQRALLIDRRPEIYFQLGLALEETLDRPAALENIVRACAFDPSRLKDIPYDEMRKEAEQRLRERYGADWVP
jgi:tetratricopeptide (TPR) repeat protein